jgi:hypothetical protein
MALILKYVCSNFGNASPVAYTYTELKGLPLFKSEPNLTDMEKYL